jgi:small subunit ribosomal protein S17
MKNKNTDNECNDSKCPIHGTLSVRGRVFEGKVTKLKEKNLKIEMERTAYIPKYERYLKKITTIHAYLPECLKKKIEIGDIIAIGECRPLSKTIHCVVLKIVRKTGEIERQLEEEKIEEKNKKIKSEEKE